MPAESIRPQDGEMSLALTHKAKCRIVLPRKRQSASPMDSLRGHLIADPEWVAKVSAGQGKKDRKCIRCLGCLQRTGRALGFTFEVNRMVGHEQYNPDYQRRSAPLRREYCLPK
jgi:hypothetical protein